jgi:hypothetical protein
VKYNSTADNILFLGSNQSDTPEQITNILKIVNVPITIMKMELPIKDDNIKNKKVSREDLVDLLERI